MKYYYGDVCLESLKVDYSYQRPLQQPWLKKIIKNYDSALARPLVISKRENGDMYVVDGNHTREATMYVCGSKASMLAKIYTDLQVREEADLFNKLNSNSKRVSFNERLKALAVANDEKTLYYIDALNDSGIKWGWRGGGGSYIFDAHCMGVKLLGLYGRQIFVDALKIIDSASNAALYSGKIVGGICYLLDNAKFDRQKLINAIMFVSSSEIVQKTRFYGTGSHDVGRASDRLYALALADIYNKGKRQSNRITLQPL